MNPCNYTQVIKTNFKSKVEKPGVVYMFPGQGSAKPGMFTSFLGDETFKKNLKVADQYLKKNKKSTATDFLTGKVINDSELALVRNISLFTCEVSLFEKIEDVFPPKKLLGHSFGEFAALVCCGAIKFEDMLRYITMREESCPKDSNGGMLVVGKIKANKVKLEKLENLYIANLNSYNQYAYSFAAKDKEDIFFRLRRERIPFIHLQNLKFPYHSPVMAEAKADLKQKWVKNPITLQSSLSYPFYSYVTEKDYFSIYELQEDLELILIEQLTTPVNFVKSIKNCLKRNELSLIECGPDNTLEVFTKNIYKESECFLPYHIHHLPKEMAKKNYGKQLLKSKWFKSLGGILSDVTGYQIKEIDVNYDFQKDLGIDSIKKAEVLYKTLDAQKLASVDQISLSSFKTVGEFVEFMENYSEQESENVLQEDNDEFHIYKLKGIEQKGSITSLGEGEYLDLMGLVLEHKNDPEGLFLKLKDQLLDLMGQKMIALNVKLPRKEILSYGVASFLKSFVRDEDYGLRVHFADEETLVFSDCIETHYNGDKVQVEKLEKVNLNDQRNYFKKVVFIGAHNGLGKVLNENSKVLEQAESILILGRSLENKQVGKIVYRKCDITDESKLFEVLNDFGEIDLLINAAGIEVSKNLAETTIEDFQKVFAIKYQAPLSLAKYCADHGDIPMVQFSSVVGYFGGRGQYTYAMANEMCAIELTKNYKNCTVLNWPALDKIGMTENLGIYQKIKESGLSMLKGEYAISLFDQVLSSTPSDKSNRDFFFLTTKDSFILDHHLYQKTEKFMAGMEMPSPKHLIKLIDTSVETKVLDHSVNEILVYPASFFIQDALGLSKHLFHRYYGHYFNFDIEVLNVGLFHQGKLSIDYFVGDERLKTEHGFFLLANKVDYAKVEINKLSDKAVSPIVDELKLNLDLSSLYNEQVITFGEAFQVTQDFTCNKEKTIGQVTGLYSRPWEVIEACFQGLSILCGANGGGLAVPQKLSGLQIDLFALNLMNTTDDFVIKVEMLTRKNNNVYGRFQIEKNGVIIGSCRELHSTTVREFDKELLKFN